MRAHSDSVTVQHIGCQVLSKIARHDAAAVRAAGGAEAALMAHRSFPASALIEHQSAALVRALVGEPRSSASALGALLRRGWQWRPPSPPGSPMPPERSDSVCHDACDDAGQAGEGARGKWLAWGSSHQSLSAAGGIGAALLAVAATAGAATSWAM
eukprot:616134-Prymnesium_polylepis.3